MPLLCRYYVLLGVVVNRKSRVHSPLYQIATNSNPGMEFLGMMVNILN